MNHFDENDSLMMNYVIQKNFNIDVFVFRQRVEFLMNVKRECEAL